MVDITETSDGGEWGTDWGGSFGSGSMSNPTATLTPKIAQIVGLTVETDSGASVPVALSVSGVDDEAVANEATDGPVSVTADVQDTLVDEAIANEATDGPVTLTLGTSTPTTVGLATDSGTVDLTLTTSIVDGTGIGTDAGGGPTLAVVTTSTPDGEAVLTNFEHEKGLVGVRTLEVNLVGERSMLREVDGLIFKVN